MKREAVSRTKLEVASGSVRGDCDPRDITLARLLGEPISGAIGIVECLRIYSLVMRKGGLLKNFSPEFVAYAVGYEGDEMTLYSALLNSGCVAEIPNGIRILCSFWKGNSKFRRRNRIKAAGGEVTPSMRSFILQRDGYTCLHCGSVYDLTIDHVYPVCLGGMTVIENLQTLCRSCNGRKKDSVIQ
jgi:hypothetical protein